MPKGKNLLWLKAVTAVAVLALCLGSAVTAFPVYGADSRDGGAPVADAGTADAGGTNTAVSNAGSADTSGADAGSADTASADTGGADTSSTDSGSVDTAGANDSGADASAADAGTADASVAEARPADTGNGAESGDANTGTGDAGSAEASPPPPDSRLGTGTSTLWTNKPHYVATEVPLISGAGFIPNSKVTLSVKAPDGTVTNLTATTNDQGVFKTVYIGGLTHGEYSVTATDGVNTTTTTFTDPQITLTPIQATYVSSVEQGTHPDPDKLHTANTPQHGSQDPEVALTYLMFYFTDDPANTKYIPPDSTIYSAELRLHQQGGGGKLEEMPYTYLGSNFYSTPPGTIMWTQAGINWNNKPVYYITTGRPTHSGPAQNEWDWIVTDLVQGVIDPSGQYLTLVLIQPTQDDKNWQDFFVPNSSHPPQLIIDFTPAQTDNPPTLVKILKLDPNGPDTGLNTQPNGLNGWWVAYPTAKLIATDDDSTKVSEIWYSLDYKGNSTDWTEVPFNPPASPVTTLFLVNREGIVTLGHLAIDSANNVGYNPAGISQTVKIDTKAPSLDEKTIDGAAPKTGWYNISDVGTDNKLVVVLKASDYEPGSGVDYIKFRVGSGSEQKDYNPDYNTDPTTPEDKDYSHTATFYIYTDDGSGNPINQGTITLYHSVVDVAGNEGSGTVGASQQIKIDTVAPTLSKELNGTLGNEGWYTSPVNVQLNAHDDTSGVAKIQYKTSLFGWWNTASAPIVNGQGPEDFSTDFTLSQEGRTTLYHRAYDAAGNKGTEPAGASQVIKIDYAEPQLYKIECGEEGDNGWYISPVYVRLTAVDPNRLKQSGINYIQYQINGGPVNKDYGPRLWLLGLPDQGLPVWATDFIVSTEGVVPLNHEAFDVAGNDSDYSGPAYYVPLLGYRVGDSQQLKIDLTDPTLAKNLSGTEGKNGWYISPVLVTLTATDAMPGSGIYEIKYSVDGTPYVVYSGAEGTPSLQTDFTLADDGIHNLTHQTRDYAGRTFVLTPQKVKVDQTPPTLTKNLSGTPGNHGWYVSPVLVTLTATDATSGVYEIRYTVNGDETTVPGGPEGTNTAEAKFTLADDGAYALTHETSDYAGHTTVLPAQEVRIDQTPPSLAKSAARTGATQVTVTLVGTDATSGVDYIRYSVDGGETWAQAPVVNGYGPNTFQAIFAVEGVGEHNLSHLVFDVAGNYYVLGDQILTIEGTTPAGMMMFVPRLVITLDILGTTAEYPVTAEGRLITDARVTSPDGSVTLEIPAGTLVLNADGSPTYLNEDYDIVFKAAGTPPAPAGYQVIAAYEALPSGLTFSKDIRLILTYDENKLPQGSSAVIAYYDEAKKQWTPLETAGYVAAGGIEMPNTVVSRVGHFTYFAVLAKLPAGK